MEYCSPALTPFAAANTAARPVEKIATHYFDTDHGIHNLNIGKLRRPEIDSVQVPFLERIPNEILSLIVELGYFHGFQNNDEANAFRTQISHTSRKLYDIVCHTPSIWSVIRVSPGNLDELPSLRMQLNRSKDHPLDIHLSSFWSQTQNQFILDQLLPHSARWQSLSINTTNEQVTDRLRHTSAPMLKHLTILYFSPSRRLPLPLLFGGHLPRLCQLRLRNVDIADLGIPLSNLSILDIAGYGKWPSHPQLLQLMGKCWSLKKLSFHVKPQDVLNEITSNVPVDYSPPITLPHLTHLEIFTSEWLSRELARFIRVFSYPNLRNLVIRDYTNSSRSDPVPMMEYTTPTMPLPSSGKSNGLEGPSENDRLGLLHVNSASLSNAWASLSPNSTSAITTLELCQAFWPRYSQAEEVFLSLKGLRRLALSKFDASDALRHLFGEDVDQSVILAKEQAIIIPSLISLSIDFNRTPSSVLSTSPYCVAAFLRLFSLPSLTDLSLKYLTWDKWHAILTSFSVHSSDYLGLTSLKVVDMADVLPISSGTSQTVDPYKAFPHLREITLVRCSANLFIGNLLPNTMVVLSDGSTVVAWPNLQSLTICHDANASKPLLHRALAGRQSMGKRLHRLVLDDHFKKNPESWEWIKGHVDVLDMATGDLLSN